MKELVRFPQSNVYLMNKDIDRANENFNELEERVDDLEEALISLARGVIGAEDMMRDIKFVLMGYSEGENTYAEGEA